MGTFIAPTSPPPSQLLHPFANTSSLLEIIPNTIDVEEESRLYDELIKVRYFISYQCTFRQTNAL